MVSGFEAGGRVAVTLRWSGRFVGPGRRRSAATRSELGSFWTKNAVPWALGGRAIIFLAHDGFRGGEPNAPPRVPRVVPNPCAVSDGRSTGWVQPVAPGASLTHPAIRSLGSFGAMTLGSFGARLGSFGARSLGSFGARLLGSFGARLGSFGATSLGSFGARLGSFGARSLGSFGARLGSLGARLGSFGARAVWSVRHVKERAWKATLQQSSSGRRRNLSC